MVATRNLVSTVVRDVFPSIVYHRGAHSSPMASDRLEEVGGRVVMALQQFPVLNEYLELAHQRLQVKKQHIVLVVLAGLILLLLATNIITYTKLFS